MDTKNLNQLNLSNIKYFLGTDVWRFLWRTLFTGALLFLVEFSFIYILQGFLVAIGLLDTAKSFLPTFFPTEITSAILILIGFGFVRSLVLFLNSYIVSTTNQAFVRHQRSMVLEYALLNAHETSMSEVMTLFGDRIAQAGQILRRIVELTILTTSLIFLTTLNINLAPRELLLSSLILLVIVLPLKKMDKKIKLLGETLRVEWEQISDTLVIGIKNNFLLKIYGLVDKEIQRGKTGLIAYEKHYHAFQAMSSMRVSFPIFAGVISISLSLYISLNYFHTPAMKLVSFIYIFIRIAQGASEAFSTFGEIQLFHKSFLDLFFWSLKLREQKKLIKPSQNQPHFETKKIKIEIKNLQFEYADSTPLFHNLNFCLPAGDIGLIQGESGSGKSTLLALLTGILKPKSGQILINDYPIELVRDQLYKAMAYVGPEPYLIRGTVKENLIFGHPHPDSIPSKELESALKQAGILETVLSLESGLNTELREQTQLSTGQKQRLSIARALLRRPAILLLDEATANLDSETEKKIIATLQSLKSEVTILLISHKDSFNKIADHYLELKVQRAHATV